MSLIKRLVRLRSVAPDRLKLWRNLIGLLGLVNGLTLFIRNTFSSRNTLAEVHVSRIRNSRR